MKTIRYTIASVAELQKHHVVKKIEAYAVTGAGNVVDLVGRSGRRLKVGDFRVIFEETETEILVTKIGPRKNVYD